MAGTKARVVALAAACAVAGLAGGPMTAPAEEPASSWMTLLKLQLRDGYNCAFESFLYWRHVPLGRKVGPLGSKVGPPGSEVGTEGRVRCLDRREYEFSRAREHEKFVIRLCQPSVC